MELSDRGWFIVGMGALWYGMSAAVVLYWAFTEGISSGT